MDKMKKPIIKLHDVKTQEIVEREMNDAEFAQFEANQAASAARQAEDEVKATAKAALLARLGITEDEARLLLGGN